MIKRIIPAILLFLVSAFAAHAQSTTVSGTITDAGSLAWANGPFKFVFQPNPQFPTGPYTWSGGALTTVITGTLDGSGHYSVSIPSNSAITPAGSTWILQITPDASSQSFSTPRTTITGGTQTLSPTPPAILISWALPPGPAISAYADGEIGGPLPKGAEYFNTTSLKTRVWNGSTWANQGAGAAGTCPTGAAGNIQYTDGTNCASSNALNYNSGTGAILFNTTGTQTYLGSSVNFAAAAGNNIVSVDGVNGIQILADDTVATTVEIGSNHGSVQFAALNINSSGGEVDFGGTAVGAGVLGLNGSTSGKCTLTSDATGTSVASGCGVTIGTPTGGSEGAGTLNATGLFVNGVPVSAGGSCPNASATQILFTDGTNCLGDADFTWNSTTHSLLAGFTGSSHTLRSGTGFLNFVQVTPSSANLQATVGGSTINVQSDAAMTLTSNNAGITQTASLGTIARAASAITDTVGNASAVTPGSVTQRAVTGTTDTILASDRQNRVAYNSATAVAVTLPQAGSSGFAGGFNTRLSNQNTGVVTVTPTTSLINGNATLVLQEGQFCFLTPSSTGTDYAADCGESQTTAGSGITLTRGVHSLQIAATGAATSIALPVTVSGTVNSGGTPYFNSTTQMSSSALLTANALVMGGGAGAAPLTVSGFSTDGSHEIFVGGVGIGSGTIGLNGNSSGTATISANSSASAVNFSGNIIAGVVQGTTLTSTVATGTAPLTVTSTTVVGNLNVSQLLGSTWASPAAIGGTTPAAGSFTALKGTTFASTTNCSSSASPAVCAAAAAGSVAVPAGALQTLQVNTTAVTANSQILLTIDEGLGTKLGVTCNTTVATLTQPVVTARTAATSFTIEEPATTSTNPVCVSYLVLN
jgi:hypothetical protein